MRPARLLLPLFCATPLWADGMLDPAFGTSGLVTTDFGPGSHEEAAALAVQPDGKAIAAGQVIPNLAQTFMGVARYLPSGALDPSFDGDGLRTVGFDIGSIGSCGLSQVLLQPDGRIIVAGWVFQAPPIPPLFHYGLARLNADGTLDASFGTGGVVQTPLAGGLAERMDALLQPDGRIVVLGTLGGVATLARYDANGTLDGTFGVAGQTSVALPVPFWSTALAVQPDGRILIAGYTSESGTADIGVARLLPNGSPDPTFDGDGIVSSDFGAPEFGASVAVLGDGRILVAGHRGSPADLALVRYLSNGALDSSFGGGGLASADAGATENAADLLVQPDGKLLVLGTRLGTPSDDFVLARFGANGALDRTFGTAGFLLTDFGAMVSDRAHAVALAGPDRVLAAGFTMTLAGGNDFGLARYIASTPVTATSFSVE